MNGLPALFSQKFELASKEERRQAIMELQLAVEKEEQIPCTVHHYFAPGSYAREIIMPAGETGMVVIGKIHKHAHVNVISKGKVIVATENGITEMQAPYTFISQPGDKRVVVVLEDTHWTTIHPTNETEIDRIEDEVIAKTYDDLALFDRKQLEGVMP